MCSLVWWGGANSWSLSSATAPSCDRRPRNSLTDTSALSMGIDASGAAVRTWLDANYLRLDQMLPLVVDDQAGIRTYRYTVLAASAGSVVRRVAVGMVADRLACYPH